MLLHLYQATGGAPLAIKWAVGQIKQKGQSLDTVLAALHGARGDIFEEVFARSWSLLNEEAQLQSSNGWEQRGILRKHEKLWNG